MKRSTIVLVVLMLASPTYADFSWDLRVGAKGAFNGIMWSEPDDAPLGSDPLWGDAQFFIGGGGGIFIEANFFGYLGLEIDVLYESNSLKFNETINSFEYDYYTKFKQVRIPIMVKGILPLGGVELFLGLGPEFVIGTGSSVTIDYRTQITDAQKQQVDAILKPLYQTADTNGTFLDTELGINIKVWKLVIPISLRVGINLSQSSDYDGRVDLTMAGATVTGARVKAIESFHFALMAGVGYVF
jgi:outer membrane protein with beta-barrel domain